MSEVSAFEAKTHFSQLLARARDGEEITITHRGKPVARLVPIRDEAGLARSEAAARRLREIAGTVREPRVTPEEIKRWIEEGRQ